MQSPFESGWWSFDLGEYRPCGGTYSLYAYESVPPLDDSLFTGKFINWLTPRANSRGARGLARLLTEADRLGVKLPAAFQVFMGDARLQDSVPSCTACEWDLSAEPVACKVVPGAYTVRFLRDQQDCLFWYLHVLPDGDAHVLCSPIPFDEPAVMAKLSPAVIVANTRYCAPHFEHFVYRFWIENVLWDKLNMRGAALTAAERAYVSHYGAPPEAPVADAAAEPAKATKKAATRAPGKTAMKKAAKKTVKRAAQKTAKRAAKKTAKRAAKAAVMKATKKAAKR